MVIVTSLICSLDFEKRLVTHQLINAPISYYEFPCSEFVNTRIDGSERSVTSNPVFCMHNLKHIAVLGSGTFGRVSLVQEAHSKKIFALKAMLKTEIVSHKQQNNVLNEKNVMSVCRHPFILQLFQTFKDVRKLYMLFEFVQGGELFAVIHTARSDGKNGHYTHLHLFVFFILPICALH
jgi:serine/threonine protein kinase